MSISKEIIYVVTCDEIIDANAEAKSCDKETKTIPKNIVCEKKKRCYILFAFLLMTTALLIALVFTFVW